MLIVEDDPIIGDDLSEIAEEAGNEVVGVARQASDARALSSLGPELALVDINLMDGPTGPHICSELARRDVTVVLMTANVKQIPLNLSGAIGALAKPFTTKTIQDVIAYADSMRHGGVIKIPRCLISANSGPIWRHPAYPI